MSRILYFDPVHRDRHQLILNYRIDNIPFSTTYWYDTVNFFALESRFGSPFMRRIYFHLLAFEANKAASLQPAYLDLGPYRDLGTAAFKALWSTIFYHVWGVWRYNNSLTTYKGPQFKAQEEPAVSRHVTLQAESEHLLLMCGGGKDSLAASILLEKANILYDTMVYSHNIYGQAQRQHDLIDGMLAHTKANIVHRGWVYDNAVDSPAAQLYPEYGVNQMLAAETVSSYWTALPIALQHGYSQVALGITRSTDEHNLVWPETGEKINYLWGMSTTAETLLHTYIQTELVSNLRFFHLLRPIYDLIVFNLLTENIDAVSATHSCAQQKPWCERCPKCLYVWMHLAAYLDRDIIDQMFTTNLFDLPENRPYLRKMLGLEGYKPTDCVGTVSETQMAFLLCRLKGMGGSAVDDIKLEEISIDLDAFLRTYAKISAKNEAMPDELYSKILPYLEAGAERAITYVRSKIQ